MRLHLDSVITNISFIYCAAERHLTFKAANIIGCSSDTTRFFHLFIAITIGVITKGTGCAVAHHCERFVLVIVT
ncbi:hypothetical protein BEL05_12220 [Shewanella colwelliana]|uniref:Uncharacterized protein n=1 Tax=Shewanella colwelliana TaxID=23 RepID=A0A1E5IWN5_SHECO|nr:hypothetical protein BEL05_12220 [Shewanella colwelliana]